MKQDTFSQPGPSDPVADSEAECSSQRGQAQLSPLSWQGFLEKPFYFCNTFQ